MKAKTLKILKIVWEIIKFIVTVGKSHEDKHLNKDGENYKTGN